MNIINRLTLRHMRLNKRRTLVTILGVIISVAMITAVATIVASLMDGMKRDVIYRGGDWQVCYKAVYPEGIEAIEAMDTVDSVFLRSEEGFSAIQRPGDPSKHYIKLTALDEKAMENLRVQAYQGRLPQNENEIMLSSGMKLDDGNSYNIGDIITLKLGERALEYQDGTLRQTGLSEHTYYEAGLNPSDSGSPNLEERLVNVQERTFTIVGLMEDNDNLSTKGEISYPAVTFLSRDAMGDGDTADVYMKVNDVDPEIYGRYNALKESVDMVPGQEGKKEAEFNEDYLYACGISSNSNINNTLYRFAGMLFVIIIVGSVSMIYNAFSISVSERSRYLGMLASVGASAAQRRRSVYFEGLVVAIIGIPLGMLAGVGGIAVTFHFLGPMMGSIFNIGGETTVYTVLPLSGAILSVVLALVTIMISCYVPARRAGRITPIDAIRQTQDIKLKARSVKTSILTRKIFGFSGELALKNLKRNRRRYRTTVFSLVLSVVLFLSVSSYMNLFTLSISLEAEGINYNAYVSLWTGGDEERKEEMAKQLMELPAAERASRSASSYGWAYLNEDMVGETVLNDPDYAQEKQDQGWYYNIVLWVLEDQSFEQYARDAGLDERAVSENPAVAVNRMVYYKDSRMSEIHPLNVSAGDVIPLRLDSYKEGKEEDEYQEVLLEGLTLGAVTDSVPLGINPATDNKMYCYLVVSQSYFDSLWAENALPGYINGGMQGESIYYKTQDTEELYRQYNQACQSMGMYTLSFIDVDGQRRSMEQLMTVLQVLVYGFVSLISLICVANIFNTISTSMQLRTREFAMLKSVGMDPRAFKRMIRYESLMYGLKALLYGLPISYALIYLSYLQLQQGFGFAFMVPWKQTLVAVIGVFAVVGITMLYAGHKARGKNIIDALKQENL